MSSPIGGKKREVKSDGFKRYIGFFRGFVSTVNPDRETLNKMFGRETKEDDKELDYTGEKDDVATTKPTFWIETDQKDSDGKPILLAYNIFMKNEVRKDKTETKIQLINQVGDNTWIEAEEDDSVEGGFKYDEDKLYSSFKNFTKIKDWLLPSGEVVSKYKAGAKPNEVEILAPKVYRPALSGEADLIDFMKTWLSDLELYDHESNPNLLLDTADLFRGDFTQLQDLVDSDFANRTYKGDTAPIGFVGLAYVKVDQDDPEKQHQKIFKTFLPAQFMKFINNGCKMPNSWAEGVWKKFMKEIDGDYGPDGHYVLEPLKEYDPSEDFATSTKTRADVTENNSKY
jgi:hypothetical protein